MTNREYYALRSVSLHALFCPPTDVEHPKLDEQYGTERDFRPSILAEAQLLDTYVVSKPAPAK